MKGLGGCGFRCPGCHGVFRRRKDRKHHKCSGRSPSCREEQMSTSLTAAGMSPRPEGPAISKRARREASLEGGPGEADDVPPPLFSPAGASAPPDEDARSSCSKGGSGSSDDMSLTQCSAGGSDSSEEEPLTPCSKGTSGDMDGSPGSCHSGSAPAGDENVQDEGSRIPWIQDIHESIFKEARAKVVDGEMPSMSEDVAEGKWTPFRNYSTMCLGLWAMKYKKYAAGAPLQGLFDMLRMTHKEADGTEHKFDPSELPQTASRFVKDVRKALPLLKVYEFPVRKKGGGNGAGEASVVSFALNEVLARNLKFPGVVESMRSRPGGRVLNGQQASDCRLRNEHVLALPTRDAAGRSTGYLTGRYSRRNPDVGIEGVTVGTGDTAYIGDSVMVTKPAVGGGPVEEMAGRLAGLFFDEGEVERGSTPLPSPKCLLAEIRPFVFPTRVRAGGASRGRDGVCRVWEPVGEDDIEVVDVSAVRRLCSVIPTEDLERNGVPNADSPLETIACAGFVRMADTEGGKRSRKPYRVASRPWNRRGEQGLQFDLRGDKVHHPREGQAVAKFPIWAFSDAFNAFNQNGTQYSVNATYAGVGCIAGHLERRLEWSYLVSIAGPGGEWQPEHTPLAKILQALQKGCRAQMAVGPGGTMSEVFVRAGLQVLKADSVYANELSDVKKPSTSEHPCAACMVSRSELGEEDVALPRTVTQVTNALERIREATSTSEADQIGRETGVVLRGEDPNPYRQYASVDTVRQIPTDIFHQDALNTKKNLFNELLKMLTAKGRRIVSCTLRDRLMCPARETMLRDITQPSALTSMTGMEYWKLAGIMLPVFRMCFISEDAMADCVKAHVLERLVSSQKLIGHPAFQDPPRNARQTTRVMFAFRALLLVSSGVSSDLRMKAFDEEILQRLEQNMKLQVMLFNDVLDLRLPTIHAGLHVVDFIREHGVPVNCCRGEAKHQELKKTMSTCSGRPADLLRHFARRANDTLAVTTLEGRVPYEARVYKEACHTWERREVVATEDCALVVERLWSTFRGKKDDDPRVCIAQPRGGAVWQAMLPALEKSLVSRDLSGSEDRSDSEDSAAATGCERPGDARNRFLPDREALAEAYLHWFGCKGAENGGSKCGRSSQCLNCMGLTESELTREVECASWRRISEKVAPGEEHETVIMGLELGEWVGEEGTESPVFGAGGSDVVLSRSIGYEAPEGSEIRRPLVRILLFFSHKLKEKTGATVHPFRGSCTTTTWAVGVDYVKVDGPEGHIHDATTHLGVFTMHRSRMVFPVEFIDGVVHMVHACASSGPNVCELDVSGWRHNPRNRRFLENSHYERGMA